MVDGPVRLQTIASSQTGTRDVSMLMAAGFMLALHAQPLADLLAQACVCV